MNDSSALQLSSGRYIQGHGALASLPEEILPMGTKVLILTDKVVYPKVQQQVESGFAKAGITFQIFLFNGYCSPTNYDGGAVAGQKMGAEVVVGMGGGRIMDAAKIVADKLGVRAITVPTSAATCAATALLAVHYSDEGAFWGNYWPKYPPAVTIADLDIIVNDCPTRYNAAGIIDAMAKLPEISYNISYSEQWKKNILSHLSSSIAQKTFDLFLENGKEVVSKMEQGIADDQVEDVVAAALSVTGLVSCLAAGGKQAAISHCLYSYFCNMTPELAERFLHGELVGASLPYQVIVNSEDYHQAAVLADFIRSLGAPTCLDDLGFAPTEEQMDGLYEFLYSRMPVSDKVEQHRLRKYADILLHGVAAQKEQCSCGK
ncbi:MAG: iron-containing alcohol dehydrogenase [Angelakisella sp.]